MPRRFFSSTAQRTALTSSITDTATSIIVDAAVGYPSSFPYTVIIDQYASDQEIVEVIARTGTTLTVIRGVDGTAAVAHDAGSAVNHGVSARDFDENNSHVNDLENPHNVFPAQIGAVALPSDATNLLKESVLWLDASESSAGGQEITNLGWGGAALNARSGSTTGVDSNDPKYLDWTGENYVYLPGVAGNSLSVPDEAALDITGDIDIRVRVAMDDWTPASFQPLLSKGGISNQSSWRLYVLTSGVLVLETYSNGITALNHTSSVATGVSDGSVKWVRATLDVDNGDSGHDVKFWLSDDGVTWTQLGSTITTAGVIALHSGTSGVFAPPQINLLAAKFYRAQVFNGIDGTPVLDVDCSQITTGAQTEFLARTGQTVTINRSTSGRKSVAVTQPSWLFGTDDYLEVPDNDLLDFGATDSFTVLAVVRQWATPVSSPYQTFIAKSSGAGASWALQNNAATYTPNFFIKDASAAYVLAPTVTWSAGPVSAVGMVVDRSAQTISAFANGAFGASASISAIGSVENANTMRVGRDSATGYNNMEGIAFAVFRRALTQYEIELLNDYYQSRDSGTDLQQPKKYVNMDAVPVGAKGDLAFNEQGQQLLVKQGDQWNGVLTEGSVLRAIPAAPAPAESLLKQAVWWIDANHSSASGQKVRNLGWGGSVLDAQAGSTGAADSNDPKFLDFDGTPYVYLPVAGSAATANDLTVPHADNLNVTTALRVTVKVQIDSVGTSWQTIAGKWPNSGTSNSWLWYRNSTAWRFTWNTAAGGTEEAILWGFGSVPSGTDVWLRLSWVADDGTGVWRVTHEFSLDGITWTRTDDTAGAATSDIRNTTAAVQFGRRTTVYTLAGKFYSGMVEVDNTLVLAVDTSVLTSGSATSFTALTGQTVTINRSTAGRKAVAVVSPVWLFGTDDYMEVADNDLIDFGASDSFTVVAVFRAWSAASALYTGIISKALSINTSTAGWLLYTDLNPAIVAGYVSDGGGVTGDGVKAAAPAATSAASTVRVLVADRSTNLVQQVIDGTPGTAASIASVGSVANSTAMRVGARANNYADMEGIAFAVFRRALTSTEITTITNYYSNRIGE